MRNGGVRPSRDRRHRANMKIGQGYLRAVTNQCGIGGGTVNVASGTNPASAIHPLSSASEKTQPFCVVSAMFTANKAENFGAVCVSSVIMSSTMMRPPGLSARLARFRMSTICAGDSWCSAPKIVTTS